jgi:hypothetical protein
MTVRAALEGHQFDLDSLARHFSTGDPRVVVNEEGSFLESADFEGLIDDVGRLVEIAGMHLARLNGYAVIQDSGFEKVGLQHRFIREDETGKHVHVALGATLRARAHVTAEAVVVLADTAEARATAYDAGTTDSTSGEPVPPDSVKYLSLAASNRDVAELLELLGGSDRLMWVELYKAYEIIRGALGNGQGGLVAAGWTSKRDLGRFTGSANHPGASGSDARHARQSGGPPADVMTLGEAQQYIRQLAQQWLQSLS